jgi:hypothetical protein
MNYRGLFNEIINFEAGVSPRNLSDVSCNIVTFSKLDWASQLWSDKARERVDEQTKQLKEGNKMRRKTAIMRHSNSASHPPQLEKMPYAMRMSHREELQGIIEFAAGPAVALITSPAEAAAGYHSAPKEKRRLGAALGLVGGIGGGLLGSEAGYRLADIKALRGRFRTPIAIGGAIAGGLAGGGLAGAALRLGEKKEKRMSAREELNEILEFSRYIPENLPAWAKRAKNEAFKKTKMQPGDKPVSHAYASQQLQAILKRIEKES